MTDFMAFVASVWNQVLADLNFWLATGGATLIKLVTAFKRSWCRAVFTGFAAIFSAVVFTDPVLDLLARDPETYRIPAAALLALTGEGLMRAAIEAANDPGKVVDLFRVWRGGGK